MRPLSLDLPNEDFTEWFTGRFSSFLRYSNSLHRLWRYDSLFTNDWFYRIAGPRDRRNPVFSDRQVLRKRYFHDFRSPCSFGSHFRSQWSCEPLYSIFWSPSSTEAPRKLLGSSSEAPRKPVFLVPTFSHKLSGRCSRKIQKRFYSSKFTGDLPWVWLQTGKR
jgi:hypothetical protein